MQHALRLCALCACRTPISAMSISQIPILAERLSSYLESISPGRGRASVEGEGPGMLQGADELSRADEHTDRRAPDADASAALVRAIAHPGAAPPAGLVARLAGGEARQEFVVARETRAAGLVGGLNTAQIAAEIHDRCAPLAGTSRIRAYRLALGVSLADVVAQIRAWYASEGRPAPGSARRCCPPTRAARSALARSTCTTCAPCTGPSPRTSGIPASASAGGRIAPGRGPSRPARCLRSRARPSATPTTGGRARRRWPTCGAGPAAGASPVPAAGRGLRLPGRST